MRYFFRDRIPEGDLLATYFKQNPSVHPDHHDYHPHFELYLRREAMPQEIVIGNEVFRVDCPAAVLTAPFSIHAMSPVLEDTKHFHRRIVYFGERFRESFGERVLPAEIFGACMNCLFLLKVTTAEALSGTLDAVFDEALPQGERALALAAVLSRLVREVPPERRHCFAGGDSYIPQILHYLYEHCAEELSSPAIAARFHVSRAKLDRDFVASVGQTLHQAVLDLRISKAKELLGSTALPIGEIAARLGFGADGTYFYTVFKRMVGVTPATWRGQHALPH